MTGPDVSKLQKLLRGTPYGGQLDVDGQYGPMTAQAVYRAKYWLGFSKPDKIAGQQLLPLLSGDADPTADMKARSAERTDKRATTAFRPWALEFARKKLGVKESPAGSNLQEFGQWYGANGVPWCAIFVTWCFATAGSKSFARSSRWSYVPYVLNDASAGRNGLSLAKTPAPGDLVLFDWDHDHVCDHIGIVESAAPLVTIEGNTSLTSNSNGGEVMRRTDRTSDEIAAFVHVST